MTPKREDVDGDGDDRSPDYGALVDGILDGEHRSLARLISHIENRREGYREAVKSLHPEAGDARIVGVTGSPGVGKSTLVDRVVEKYRERGDTVGVVAVDPASPYTGGSILGDRIRVKSRAGDMDVFFRSMSARGELGGLAAATRDAVTALDAFGKDVVVVETVGAGQSEVEIVRTSETVVVLLTPSSGDDVQMLKAGILEIGDVFVVNKSDKEGADRTVMEVEEMVDMRDDDGWEPRVLKTVAKKGEGVGELVDALDDHHDYLVDTGEIDDRRRQRYEDEVRDHLEDGFRRLAEKRIEDEGGFSDLVGRVVEHETDPYTAVEEVLEPVEECVEEVDEKER